jgi:hypothetical protein
VVRIRETSERGMIRPVSSAVKKWSRSAAVETSEAAAAYCEP